MSNNWCPSMAWDEHIAGEDAAEIGRMQDWMEAELKKLSSRHNTECFPICSFGWKEADLSTQGCCGIKLVQMNSYDDWRVTVSGHKTLCSPTEDLEFEISDRDKETIDTVAQEIASGCGYPGEWTGDDWCLHFEETFLVPWEEEDSDKELWRNAVAIYDTALKKCRPFEEAMELAHEMMNGLYENLAVGHRPGDESTE